MIQNLRKTVNAFTLNHLYALLIGLVLFILGGFLFDHVTNMQGSARDLREYRPYGFGLMWVAGLFIWLVIRDARKRSE